VENKFDRVDVGVRRRNRCIMENYAEVLELLAKFRDAGVSLFLDGDCLEVEASDEQLTDEMINDLKLWKTDIIRCLRDRESGVSSKSISKADTKEFYPLSSAQKRLYILQGMDSGSVAYNISGKISLGTGVVLGKVEESFRALLRRHESLRTSFHMIDGEPMQKVHDTADLSIEYLDLEAAKVGCVFREFARPFDLSNAPLVRVGVVKLKGEFVLLYDLHHIVTDGVSQSILESEFAAYYNGEALEPLELQYRDFSEWQESEKRLGKLDLQKDYWVKIFEDEPPVLDLPADYSRPSVQSFEGNSAFFALDWNLTADLREFCKDCHVTLFMSLVGAFSVLLGRLSGQEDIVIGTPTAGRRHLDLEKIIGMFVNTVPLRSFPVGDIAFIDFIGEVKQRTIDAFDNQDFQFEDIVETVVDERDSSRNPIFDVMLSLENQTTLADEHVDGDDIIFRETGVSKFDMNWEVFDSGERLLFHIEYCTRLFGPKRIEKFISCFRTIVRSVVKNPSVLIKDIELISDQEKELIRSFSENCVHYEKNLTVFHFLEKFAESDPLKVAFAWGKEKIVYKDLNDRVNQLARCLRKKGVFGGRIVGVLMERSFDMVISILSIWKAGGAYVPISVDYPAERICELVEGSDAVCLLVNDGREYLRLESRVAASILDLSQLGGEVDFGALGSFESDFGAQDLAYVIFTSGSTGEPKGAMVNHDGMINHLHAKINELAITKNCIVAQTASHTFDISVWQFFATIMVGGTTVIIPDDTVLDSYSLLHSLIENRVNLVELVPSHLAALLHEIEDDSFDLSHLKYLLVTGEVVQPSLVNRWFSAFPAIPMVNAYGPTEASDDITHHKMHGPVSAERVPIGKPIQNLEINIVDMYMNLCPVGVKGEIVVSGVGVGGGYINNEQETRNSFVEDVFNPGLDRKMYKTGDLGMWLDDGAIDFFGRIDNQVKVRGFRIELGEIEAKLGDIFQIREAVVLEREAEADQKYLCAYFVSGEELEVAYIRNELLRTLPEYMVPSYFFRLEKMPLTANGKVNRKALPEPEVQVRGYVAPRNEIEELLQDLWSEILRTEKERLSVGESFFALGGSSIAAMKVISGVRKAFGVELTIRAIFEKSTMVELGGVIGDMLGSGESDSKFTELSRVERNLNQAFPMAPVQEAVWYLLELKPDSAFYNIDYVFDVRGELKVDALLKAINILMAARDVFKIRFSRVGEEVRQVYVGERGYEWGDLYVDLRGRGYEAMHEELGRLLNSQPDLADSPIVEFRVYHLEEDLYKFVFVTSHIIWDQASSISFFEELSKLYNKTCRGEDLVACSLNWDYLDYCSWHRALLDDGKLEVSRRYWLSVFETVPKPLELPADYIRPDIQTFEGGDEILFLDPAERRDVDRFCSENEITYQIFFLSVLNLWISRMSGQDDFLVGTPMSSRVADVFDDSFGLFAAGLPIRCSIQSGWKFSSLLDYIRNVSLESYEHHLYPVSKVIEELDVSREVANNQFIRVFFGVQNDETDMAEIVLDGLEIVPSGEADGIDSPGTSHFDFTFQIDYTKDSMRLRINYSKDLYKAESAKRQLAQLRSLAFQCIQDSEKFLSDYSLHVDDDEAKLSRFIGNYVGDPGVGSTVFDLWESAVEKFGERPALKVGDSVLSYCDLAADIDTCSAALVAYGVRATDRIGLVMGPSKEAIVLMLASLKIGAIYVPTGEKVPEQRLKMIVRQANVKCLVRGIGSIEIRASDAEVSDLFIDYEDLVGGSFEDEERLVSHNGRKSEDAAYMIFTSGTTGTPKGIRISNRGVVNLIESSRRFYRVTEQDRSFFHTPINFDASVLDVYLPLLSGGCVVVAGEDVYGSLIKFREALIEERVTFVQFIPAMLDGFLCVCELCDTEDVFQLRTVISGGAPLPRSIRDRFFRSFDCRLTNNYGPSEITVDAARFDCSGSFDGNIVPLGQPISNTDIYILDTRNRLCPIGVVGEIGIFSAGTFEGYEGADGDRNSPFAWFNAGASDRIRLFMTGDYGYYGVDGNLYFIGREDGQIKVNGNRVEVDEVEAVLHSIDSVKNASVLSLRGKGSNCSMVGFVELQDDSRIDLGAGVDAFTLEQNPGAKREMRLLHAEAWPCFFQGSAVVRDSWEELLALFPELQVCLLDPDNRVTAVGNAVAFDWDGSADGLPRGWDEVVRRGVKVREDQSRSEESMNTVVVLAAVTRKDSRGKGLSRKVIEAYRALALSLGYSNLLVALRPLGKEAFPSMTVKDFTDGHLAGTIEKDFWIELHTRLGGRVIKCSDESQLVSGSFSDWQDWTGVDLESGDSVAISGLLSELVIDSEMRNALYYDPCVWIEHTLERVSGTPEYVSVDKIRTAMSDWLPDYAIPGRMVVVNTIPKFDSGKVDRRKLEIVGFEAEQALLVKPESALEEQICECFAEALGAPCGSVHQNFFESGGHSLSALRLVYSIESKLEIALSLRELFHAPTPYRVAALISSKGMECSLVAPESLR